MFSIVGDFTPSILYSDVKFEDSSKIGMILRESNDAGTPCSSENFLSIWPTTSFLGRSSVSIHKVFGISAPFFEKSLCIDESDLIHMRMDIHMDKDWQIDQPKFLFLDTAIQ